MSDKETDEGVVVTPLEEMFVVALATGDEERPWPGIDQAGGVFFTDEAEADSFLSEVASRHEGDWRVFPLYVFPADEAVVIFGDEEE